MSGTLITACLAYFRANLTNSGSKFTLHRHQLGCQSTDAGALSVRSDAFAHHLQVFFLQARGCAIITGCGADVTGLDAAAIEFRHNLPLLTLNAKKL